MPYHAHGEPIARTGLIRFGRWTVAPRTEFGPSTPGRTHLLLWIIDGSATVYASDGEFALPAGSVLVTPPGVSSRYVWDHALSTHHVWVDFDPAPGAVLPRLRMIDADDVVTSLLKHMVWLSAQRPPDWAGHAHQAFDYVLRVLGSGSSGTRLLTEGASSELLVRAVAVMQRHWRRTELRPPTLEELAAAVGVSARHLSRVFSAEIGVSPIAALRMVRIVIGADLLTRSDMSIAAVARETGFSSEFHFSRVFKTIAGSSPRQYRKSPWMSLRLPPGIQRLSEYMKI